MNSQKWFLLQGIDPATSLIVELTADQVSKSRLTNQSPKKPAGGRGSYAVFRTANPLENTLNRPRLDTPGAASLVSW